MAKIVLFAVALATLFCIGSSYKIIEKSGSLDKNDLKNRLDNLEELRNKWSLNAIEPPFFKDFMQLYHQHKNNSQITNHSEKLSAERDFMDKVLNGVSSDSCKVHVTEWFTRFSLKNLEGVLGEKDAWVLQSK